MKIRTASYSFIENYAIFYVDERNGVFMQSYQVVEGVKFGGAQIWMILNIRN
jgi:hypothetical protein